MKATQLEKMTIAELEAHLDEEKELGTARDYLKSVMAVRNQKIKQEQLDHYGLTEEQYDAAIYAAGYHDRLERDIDADKKRLEKIEEELKVPGQSKEELAAFKKEVAELRAQIDENEKLFEDTKRIPKHVHLQQAQRKAGQAAREAQTAFAGQHTNKLKTKGVK